MWKHHSWNECVSFKCFLLDEMRQLNWDRLKDEREDGRRHRRGHADDAQVYHGRGHVEQALEGRRDIDRVDLQKASKKFKFFWKFDVLQGDAGGRVPGLSWHLISRVHHFAQLLSRFCQILNCPSRTTLTVEWPKWKSIPTQVHDPDHQGRPVFLSYFFEATHNAHHQKSRRGRGFRFWGYDLEWCHISRGRWDREARRQRGETQQAVQLLTAPSYLKHPITGIPSGQQMCWLNISF